MSIFYTPSVRDSQTALDTGENSGWLLNITVSNGTVEFMFDGSFLVYP